MLDNPTQKEQTRVIRKRMPKKYTENSMYGVSKHRGSLKENAEKITFNQHEKETAEISWKYK